MEPDDSSDNSPAHMAIKLVVKTFQTRCVHTRTEDGIDWPHEADLTLRSVHWLCIKSALSSLILAVEAWECL